jgi:ribonuclease HII
MKVRGALKFGYANYDGYVVGVDEAGRGPLAGPVVAAAVVLDPNVPIPGLDDSKRLTASKRAQLCQQIKRHALAFALGRASVHEIDEINILQASLLAMRRAVAGLAVAPQCALIDGHIAPGLPCAETPVVKGDATFCEIAAASILAKVERDAQMVVLDYFFPKYGFVRHKGYPTREHLDSLAVHGVSPVHRRSFAPVRKLLGTPRYGPDAAPPLKRTSHECY